MKKLNKVLSLGLAFAMVVGLTTVNASAATGEIPEHDCLSYLLDVEAVEATCESDGSQAYSYCAVCDSVWQEDEVKGYALTNRKNLTIPAAHTNVIAYEAIEPGCHYDGNIAYWTCADCNAVWADEALTQVTNIKNVVLPAVGGIVNHVEAKDAACDELGNIEYWYCDECEQVWQDEALTQLTNHKNVIIGTEEHAIVHMEAVEPGCHYNGNIEYWYCADCDAVWQDEALTQLTNAKRVVLPATGADVNYVEAKNPACHENGNIEYWYCDECEQVWQDEALTQLTNIKNVVIAATGSDMVVHFDAVAPNCWEAGSIEYWFCGECQQLSADVAFTEIITKADVAVEAIAHENVVPYEAVEATCHSNGNGAYWYCPDCDNVWADEALTQQTNRLNMTIPATGSENLVYFEAVEAGCHSLGNIEYWYCPDCEGFWQDEALTQLTNAKNVIVAATGSENLVHFEAVEPGCHYDGNIEYWYCPDCEKYYQNEACTQLTNAKRVVLPATGSENVVHFEAVEPGCHDLGNIEYWYCADCEQFWQDEALTQLTNSKNVVLAELGSEKLFPISEVKATCWTEGNIAYWYCADCDRYFQDEACTQLTNSKRVILPAIEHANVVHMEAVAPGCHYNGNVEYWYCPDCEGFWTDAALTQVTNSKSVILPALGEDVLTDGDAGRELVIHFEAIEAGCHNVGNIEYWYCTECEQYWQDAALTQVTNSKNVIVPATGAEVGHVEAVAPGCHYDGNIEYWWCPECEGYWQDAALTQLTNSKNVILPALGEDILTDGDADKELIVHVEAVAPTCHDDGNIEYWYCTECDQVWQDEALTQLTNIKNVVLPATGAEVIYFAAVEPGCHYDGNIEYWYCADCNRVWQDEALTQLTNIKNVVLPATGAEVTYVEAIEPGCHYDGNIEYWYCADCEQVWQDEALTQLTNIKNVVLPATGSENVIHFDAIEAGCHYDGNIEYWYCADCEQVWQDEALTQLTNIKNVVVPATGAETIHFEAIEPGCHYDGNIEYWYCADCEQVWQDAALTQLTNIKNVVLPAVGGETVHFEAIEPGCHYDGQIEYWYCAECEQFWQDEALTQLTNSKNVVLPAVGGEVNHVEAVAPTAGVEGNIEYWWCEECEQFWQDAALTQLTNSKNVILPALDAEEPEEPGTEEPEVPGTEEPGTEDGENNETPETGDNANMVLWISILGLGLVAVAGSVVMKKRTF